MQLDRALALMVPGLVVLATSRVTRGDCIGPPANCLPALSEHGSIAGVSVAPPLPTPKAKVPDGGAESGAAVESAAAIEADDDLERGLSAYDPHDTLFSSALAARVASLGGCRVEVARARRVRPADLAAETAHLRLWVASDGRVVDSLVATEGGIGTAFLDCVKREVQGWRLVPPQSGKGAYVDVNADIPAVGSAKIGPRRAPP
jgi:hypothetical protein